MNVELDIRKLVLSNRASLLQFQTERTFELAIYTVIFREGIALKASAHEDSPPLALPILLANSSIEGIALGGLGAILRCGSVTMQLKTPSIDKTKNPPASFLMLGEPVRTPANTFARDFSQAYTQIFESQEWQDNVLTFAFAISNTKGGQTTVLDRSMLESCGFGTVEVSDSITDARWVVVDGTGNAISAQADAVPRQHACNSDELTRVTQKLQLLRETVPLAVEFHNLHKLLGSITALFSAEEYLACEEWIRRSTGNHQVHCKST